MTLLQILLLAGAIIGLTALVYGAHRLGLYLENRGLIYYWHKRPSGGAARMWVPLQEAIEPQIQHVIEAEEQTRKQTQDEQGEAE